MAVTRASCNRASLSAMTLWASARAFSVFLRALVSSASLKSFNNEMSALKTRQSSTAERMTKHFIGPFELEILQNSGNYFMQLLNTAYIHEHVYFEGQGSGILR